MENIVARGLQVEAAEILDDFPVLKIHGARQVGKSTLSQMLVQDRDSIYKSLDRELFREQAEEDADFFVESPAGTTMVIDEIQRVPKVSLAVKHSVDEQRSPGRFILTGSSDFMRAVGPKDSLAGRSAGIKLYPLSFAERLGTLASGTFVDRFVAGKLGAGSEPDVACTRQELAELIAVGGYPSVQGKSAKQCNRWFDAYVKDVVGLDVLDQKLTPYPGRLQAVLRMLAAQQSQELVRATLARETQIPETSIVSYLDILERIFLIELVQPWSRNLVEREKGKPKILVSDTGLATFLAGQSPEKWLDYENPDPYFGRAIEAAITQELKAQSGWADNNYGVYHWRDRTGREVDIVCELADGSVVAFEIKAGAPRAKHFDTLKFFREKLGDKFLGGFVVADTPQVDEWSKGLFSIPWSSLWS